MKEINMRRLYRPIESVGLFRKNGIQLNNTLPFFLDIFANDYYIDQHQSSKIDKRNKKRNIKNKILDYLRNYRRTLGTFSISDNDLINVNDTYFMQKIMEHNDIHHLNLETNYINPNSLVPPTSLFIKDNIPLTPVYSGTPSIFNQILRSSTCISATQKPRNSSST